MRKGSVPYRLLACGVLLLSFFSVWFSASALEGVNLNRKVSLTLHVTEDNPKTGVEQSLPGVTFRLYRVASLNADISYTLTDAFTGSAVDVNAIENADDALDAAILLEAYIDREKIEPNLKAVSDESGYLTFADMKPGLFLVLSSPIEISGYAYTFSPVMVALPQTNAEQDTWLYDITSEIKMERREMTFDLRVIKHWEQDSGVTNTRPEYIQIRLLRDGKAFKTVKLNSGNGWQAVFRNLSALHKWTVEEVSVPEGYSVSYGKLIYGTDGNASVIVTNRYYTPPSKIAQTGQLWWPVPVLLAVGAVLVLAGWLLMRRGKRSHE